MFLQNLLKKLDSVKAKFKDADLKSIFINNFRDIIIIFVSLWIVVMALILFFVVNGKGGSSSDKISKNDSKNRDYEKEQKEELQNNLLLNADDFVFPDLRRADLTNDIVDLLPKKKFELPEKNFIKKEYNKMLAESIDESLKFNFEKRRAKD